MIIHKGLNAGSEAKFSQHWDEGEAEPGQWLTLLAPAPGLYQIINDVPSISVDSNNERGITWQLRAQGTPAEAAYASIYDVQCRYPMGLSDRTQQITSMDGATFNVLWYIHMYLDNYKIHYNWRVAFFQRSHDPTFPRSWTASHLFSRRMI